MLKRTLSGAVLIVVAFFAFLLGGYYLFGLTLALSLLGMFELYRACKIEKTPQAVISYIGAIGYYVSLLFDGFSQYLFTALCIYLIALLITYVLTFPKVKSMQMMCAPFGLIYVAIFLSFVYRTRMLDGGLYYAWIILLGAWGSDTFAYLVGCSIGKHKAFPVLSPKKTWEGCFGGVAGAFLVGSLFGLIFADKLPSYGIPSWLVVGFVCFGAAILSMFGDLTASAIKRDNGVKDYGKLIPGHGGVLDRFDSVLFTAPAVYFLVVLFERLS